MAAPCPMNPCCGGACPGQFCVTATNICSSVAVVGATVTVTGPSGFSGTCTTDSLGKCCVSYTAAGSYTITISQTGFSNYVTTLTATCATQNITATMSPAGPYTLNVLVTGCGGAMDGVLVSVTDGVGFTGTCTTTLTGCSISVPALGTYTVTASRSRFVTQTVTVSVSNPCSATSRTINLVIDTGYACSSLCLVPLLTTLNLTDSRYGSTTISWNGTTGWTGTLASVINCNGGQTMTISYFLAASGLALSITAAFVPSGGVNCGFGGHNPIGPGPFTCPYSVALHYQSNCQNTTGGIYCNSGDTIDISE